MPSLWSRPAFLDEGVLQSVGRTAPMVVCAGVLAWLSLSPHPHDSGLADLMGSLGGDMASHALAWFVLALGARWAVDFVPAPRGSSLVAWALCMAYGVFLEGLQAGVPGRGAQWIDLLGDGLGGAVGVGILSFWLKRRRGDGET